MNTSRVTQETTFIAVMCIEVAAKHPVFRNSAHTLSEFNLLFQESIMCQAEPFLQRRQTQKERTHM